MTPSGPDQASVCDDLWERERVGQTHIKHFLCKTFPRINTDRIRNSIERVFVLLFLAAGQADSHHLANICI